MLNPAIEVILMPYDPAFAYSADTTAVCDAEPALLIDHPVLLPCSKPEL